MIKEPAIISTVFFHRIEILSIIFEECVAFYPLYLSVNRLFSQLMG